jgi:hypothetical protein
MKISEIIKLEKENRNSIHFLKEGMFFRAFNVSAMRVVKHLRHFKVNSKFIKNANETILYCGFPETSIDLIHHLSKTKGFEWKTVDEKRIDVIVPVDPDENYEGYKNDIVKTQVPLSESKAGNRMDAAVVLEKHYDLILWVLPKLANFPKDQRFLLSDRIESLLLDILGLLIEAVYAQDRTRILEQANLKLDQLRYLVRITKDMKYISVKQYDFFCMRIIEIGRMVGGWRKAASAKARERVSIPATSPLQGGQDQGDACCGMEKKEKSSLETSPV